ncbi:MAG: helix-turn-helix domain-containing protein [Sphingomicrobium sp.]
MQIHQQRAERFNLERLVDRVLFDSAIANDEQAKIRSLWRSARHDPANTVLSAPDGPRLITSGWAGWLRCSPSGRRQIFLFLMPGDFIVPSIFQPEGCDLVSLTPLRTVDAAPLVENAATLTPRTAALVSGSGRYYRLLLLDHLTRLTIGCTKRSLAHLLVEFYARSLRSGACVDGRFSFPIGQRVLASALGRSTVQVNKIINQFQVDGLLAVGYDWLKLRDPDGMRGLAGMADSILYPARPVAGLPARLGSRLETSAVA